MLPVLHTVVNTCVLPFYGANSDVCLCVSIAGQNVSIGAALGLPR